MSGHVLCSFFHITISFYFHCTSTLSVYVCTCLNRSCFFGQIGLYWFSWNVFLWLKDYLKPLIVGICDRSNMCSLEPQEVTQLNTHFWSSVSPLYSFSMCKYYLSPGTVHTSTWHWFKLSWLWTFTHISVSHHCECPRNENSLEYIVSLQMDDVTVCFSHKH